MTDVRQHLQDWALAVGALLAPPRAPMRFGEFCRTIRLPDGPQAGRLWRPQDEPAQAAAVEAMEADRHGAYVGLGPVQRGKTLTFVLARMLYLIQELRESFLYGLPDVELAKIMWSSKTLPAIRATGFADTLPEEGSGARGGKAREYLFRTGARAFLMGAGGRNEAGQSSVTVKHALLDEVDSMRRAARNRRDLVRGSHHLTLLLQRTEAFGSEARHYFASTLKDDYHSLIESLWEAGTGGLIHLRCPACGAHAPLSWDQIRYDDASHESAYATARWACAACSTLQGEEERQRALADALVVHRGQAVEDGRVVGAATGHAWSLRWSGLDSRIHPLGRMAQLHREATIAREQHGNHEPMRQFFRDHLTQPYRVDVDEAPQIHERVVAVRSAEPPHYQRGELPSADIVRVTVGVDCQLRELFWLALAEDAVGRWYLIDWNHETICGRSDQPTAAQRHEALDRLDRRFADGWPLPDGRPVPPVHVGLDVNAYTEELLAWLRFHWGRWMAVRGVGEETASKMAMSTGALAYRVPGWCEVRVQPAKWRLCSVDADTVRARLHDGLVRDVADAGSLSVPAGVAEDSRLARHLCAELRVVTDTGVVWVTRRRDNHLLDCAVYAAAVGRLHATRMGQSPARPTPTADADPAPAQPHPAPPPRPAEGGWIGGGGGGWL